MALTPAQQSTAAPEIRNARMAPDGSDDSRDQVLTRHGQGG